MGLIYGSWTFYKGMGNILEAAFLNKIFSSQQPSTVKSISEGNRIGEVFPKLCLNFVWLNLVQTLYMQLQLL